MRILALVTARGGSKRLPGKNIRLLGGRPLIAWSIDAVRGMAEIADVLVSTDDSATAEIARSNGALVPWLRPDALATNTASSVDVALHGLAWYETARGNVDGLLLLQPTSPFRRRSTVQWGIELFQSRQHRTVIGVSPASSHPGSCFKLKGDGLVPFIAGADQSARSQDLEPAYVVNGGFYLIAPAELRREKSFYAASPVALVSEAPEERIDIDTEWDWKMAETFLASNAASE